jgi:hypothetical protein
MELGAVRPAAMLGREQFNSIIHTQQASQPPRGYRAVEENG